MHEFWRLAILELYKERKALKTKLFGSTGLEDETREDLAVLLESEQSDLDRLASWLTQSAHTIPLAWSEIEEMVEGTSFDASTANQALLVTRFLLSRWCSLELTLPEISADLIKVGYSDKEAQKLVSFLAKLQDVRERVYRSAMKRGHEIRGLPTIDDLNLVWDIRPVFQDYAYDSPPGDSAYERIVTHTYTLIAEILASRENGEQESVSIQLSEDDLERLMQALQRSKKQLEVAKKHFGL